MKAETCAQVPSARSADKWTGTMSPASNLATVDVSSLCTVLDDIAYNAHLAGNTRDACAVAARQVRSTRELLHDTDSDPSTVLQALRALYGVRKAPRDG